MNSDHQTRDAEAGSSGGGLAITDVYFVLFDASGLCLSE